MLRELVDVIAEPGQRARGEPRAALRRPVRRDLRATWVAPYIGDLVGYRTLHGVVPQVASPRADVANTIRYRRRKGTVSVLEQLAADVTGWPAHAVEFFELLATTQYMNHIRPHARRDRRPARRGAARARRSVPGGRVRRLRAHGRDARGSRRGRAATTSATSASSSGACSRFASRARRSSTPTAPASASASTSSGPTSRSSPRRGPSRRSPISPSRSTCRCRCCAASRGAHLADALRRRALVPARAPRPQAAIDPSRQPTFASATSRTIPAAPGAWAHEPQPADTHVAVDPVLGRVAFPAAPAAGETRLATFHYGSALAIGGGGYDRAASLEQVETRRHRLAAATRSARRSRRSPAAARCRSSTAAPTPRPPTITATTPAADAADRTLVLALGEPRTAAALARRPAQARDGARHDRRAERARARRRAARDRGVRRRRAAEPRPPPLHARARAHARPGRLAALDRPRVA